jgi:hypothetical protein
MNLSSREKDTIAPSDNRYDMRTMHHLYICARLASQNGSLLVRSCGTEGDVFVLAPK